MAEEFDIRRRNRFQEGRERAGLSRAEAAEALGVSRGTVRRWEHRTHPPKLAALTKMARAYDASAD